MTFRSGKWSISMKKNGQWLFKAIFLTVKFGNCAQNVSCWFWKLRITVHHLLSRSFRGMKMMKPCLMHWNLESGSRRAEVSRKILTCGTWRSMRMTLWKFTIKNARILRRKIRSGSNCTCTPIWVKWMPPTAFPITWRKRLSGVKRQLRLLIMVACKPSLKRTRRGKRTTLRFYTVLKRTSLKMAPQLHTTNSTLTWKTLPMLSSIPKQQGCLRVITRSLNWRPSRWRMGRSSISLNSLLIRAIRFQKRRSI